MADLFSGGSAGAAPASQVSGGELGVSSGPTPTPTPGTDWGSVGKNTAAIGNVLAQLAASSNQGQFRLPAAAPMTALPRGATQQPLRAVTAQPVARGPGGGAGGGGAMNPQALMMLLRMLSGAR